MDDVINRSQKTLTITIPSVDISLFKALAKKMGWNISKKSGLEIALEDVSDGKTHKASSTEDMFKQILE